MTAAPRGGTLPDDPNAPVFRNGNTNYRNATGKGRRRRDAATIATSKVASNDSTRRPVSAASSPMAIVRRPSSSRRRRVATPLPCTASTTSRSTAAAAAGKLDSSATLTGPYTRSDPKVYGATDSTYHPNARFAKKDDPADAAIYAVQTSPRDDPLTAIERGRLQFPAKRLAKPIGGSLGGHKAAAEFGQDLRHVADRIPTPAPQSLDMVAPALQKAILWPDAAREREHWPDKKRPGLGLLANKLRGAPTFAPTRLTQPEFVARLGRACRLGDADVVASLLDERHALDWINLPGEDGATALHEAAAGGAVEVVQDLLLPSGADPTIEAGYLGTPLDVARDRLARLQRSAPVNSRREQEPDAQLLLCLLQTTNIWQASLEGDLGRVRHLLDFGEGMRADARNPYGCTALHYACMGAMPKVIELLLDRGASVRAKNNIGQTPEDVAKEAWVVDMLDREARGRRERRRERKERHRAIASIRDAREQADRDAWMSARGTSAAVPLARRLEEHAKHAAGGSGVGGSSQKRGVFAAGRANPGRYLLARPGSAHNTTAIVRRSLPSDRILDPGKSALQGTSRLRHVRRLSHGMDSPSVVFDQFWRWDMKQGGAGTSSRGRSSIRNKSSKKNGGGGAAAAAAVGRRRPSSATSARSKKKKGVGHPSPNSQEFAEWLRLHFGTAVPMQGPPQMR
jgi:hypothetical protein